VMFNAALVSAQSRKRLFWTNIKFDLPEDRGIMLKDILQAPAEVDERMLVKGGKSACIDANYHKGSSLEHAIKKKVRTMVYVGAVGGTIRKGMEGQEHLSRGHHEGNRIYDPIGKAPTLSANGGGTAGSSALIKVGREIGRRLNAEGTRADADATLTYQRRIETREDGKCGTLTSVQKDNLVVSDVVRKLTPIECERLQGLPDNYTEGIAMTHRYKCCGNAFNVDVVAHILRGIPNG